MASNPVLTFTHLSDALYEVRGEHNGKVNLAFISISVVKNAKGWRKVYDFSGFGHSCRCYNFFDAKAEAKVAAKHYFS